MGWHATDDHFPSHRKVLRLRQSPFYPHALALWILAGAWCCSQEHERFTGEVSFDVLASFGIADWYEAAGALIDVGLWEADGDDGARFHDWSDWNGISGREYRSKEQARLRQQAFRKRQCEAGNHDRHCPSDTCPVKLKRASSEAGNAGSRDPGSGRDGSGRDGSGNRRLDNSNRAHEDDEQSRRERAAQNGAGAVHLVDPWAQKP